MEVFEMSFWKIIRYYFLIPLIVLPFFIEIIYDQTDHINGILYFGFFLLISLPNVLIFINHYLYFNDVIFKYDALQQKFYFIEKTKTLIFKKEEIVSIDEYRSIRGINVMNSICFWEIYLKNGERVKLAPLIIKDKKVIQLFSDIEIVVKTKVFLTK